MRSIETVLAAGARNDAVVEAVPAAITVAQLVQLPFALGPVNAALLLLGQTAGVADALYIKVDRFLPTVFGVLVFDRGIRPLVRNHAVPAEANPHWQSVAGHIRRIRLERSQVNVTMTRVSSH